jgi:formiminoglutamate deiminase
MARVRGGATAGIGLTLLPVFYAHGGFGGSRPPPASAASCTRRCRSRGSWTRSSRTRPQHGYVVGVAPHSLRAVTAEELGQIVRMAPAGRAAAHPCREQTREVDECYAWSRMRPIEWLLTQANIDERWCVIHATHMTEREVAGLAQSGAVAGLAPTTEADLGDGTFPAEAYAAAAGRFGVGSDSNTVIDPFAELRQLEWSQRMRFRRRNVLAPRAGNARRHRAVGARRARTAPMRSAAKAACSWRGRAPISSCSTATTPRWPSSAPKTCSTPPCSAPAAGRCGT